MSASLVARLAPKLSEMAGRRAEVDRLLADPAVAANPARVTDLYRERGALDRRVSVFREWERVHQTLVETERAAAQESDREMAELYRAELASEAARLDQLEAQLVDFFLVEDEDGDRNVLLEIRAGTGGDEAALWAGDLLRMYTRYADNRKWNVELLSESATPLGGYREVVARISGTGAYSRLRFESGVHRVQRVPVTESQGRIHTSTATVAVLPEVTEVDVQLRDQDLKTDVYRSSGPGGQNVNKTSSAIRITHLPSGIVVACQDERSQHKNRQRALMILRSRLYDFAREERDKKRAAERRAQVGSGDRSEKIRTYNYPQSRVTDHRVEGIKAHDLPSILDGGVDDLIQPLIDHERELRLRELLSGAT